MSKKNHAAWIFQFAGWLTMREEPVTMGSTHDCANVAELCGEFCKKVGLEDPNFTGQDPLHFGKEDVVVLPDGSACGTMSFPLPNDHWIYSKEIDDPDPCAALQGIDDETREAWKTILWRAGQYAVRAATMNGTEMDFDPDALIQNLVVAMLGYHPTVKAMDGEDEAWDGGGP